MDKPPRPVAQLDDGVADGLRAMKVSEQDIAAEMARRAPPAIAVDFYVHEDNWAVWQFFMQLQTQWVYASNGLGVQRTGLPSNRVESEARMMGWPRSSWAALLGDVRVMEQTLLACDAELAAKQAT